MQEYELNRCLSRAIALTSSLIEIDTTTGKEFAALKALENIPELKSLVVNKIPIAGQPRRYNMMASMGKPKIVFSTHIDTVPCSSSQRIARVDNGRLYGRGSCDAKGILATMIVVVDHLRQKGETDLGLLVVSDEEADALGARACCSALSDAGIKYLINGEPTENHLFTGHRGSFEFSLKIHGIAVHSGYPELGIDAFVILSDYIIALREQIAAGAFGEESELGGKPTFNVNKVFTNGARNVVPDLAECEIYVRTVEDSTKIYEFTHDYLRSYRYELGQSEGDSPIEYELKILVERGVAKGLMTAPGIPTSSAKYGTDIPCFGEMSENYLLYGPGSIHQAHTEKEYVEISQLRQAILDYLRLFEHLKVR